MCKLIRNALTVVAILLTVIAVLLRGLWYPGVTGEQKAEILLSDEKFPSRALFAIALVDDSTLAAMARKSSNFEQLSLTGQAMVTRIAMCQSGSQFVEFAKTLSSARDERVRQIGRVALTHRGIPSPMTTQNSETLAKFFLRSANGDIEQQNVINYLLATNPTAIDVVTRGRIEERLRADQMSPDLAAAILLSSGFLYEESSQKLMAELLSKPTSRYRVATFWALHFSIRSNDAIIKQLFLPAIADKPTGQEMLLTSEMNRAGRGISFPTAYSEYLCK